MWRFATMDWWDDCSQSSCRCSSENNDLHEHCCRYCMDERTFNVAVKVINTAMAFIPFEFGGHPLSCFSPKVSFADTAH